MTSEKYVARTQATDSDCWTDTPARRPPTEGLETPSGGQPSYPPASVQETTCPQSQAGPGSLVLYLLFKRLQAASL